MVTRLEWAGFAFAYATAMTALYLHPHWRPHWWRRLVLADKTVHTSEVSVNTFSRSPEEMESLRQEVRERIDADKAVAEANEKAEGLHRKYHVERINDPDGKHADCRYFVLDPQHDPLAVEALEAYSDAAFAAGYIPLSKEIDHWIGRETVPARTPNPEHSGSPFLPCKPCDRLIPGRGGLPGGIGGCIGAEPAEPLAEEVAESGSEHA